MIVTLRMIIRNAQSGAAGNQTICAIVFTETKKTAATRAPELPLNSPTPVRATIEPRIRWIQPQVVRSAMSAPRPPTTTTWSLRIAARPQRASSDPTMRRSAPAKTVQPVGCRCEAPPDADIQRPFSTTAAVTIAPPAAESAPLCTWFTSAEALAADLVREQRLQGHEDEAEPEVERHGEDGARAAQPLELRVAHGLDGESRHA